MRVALDSDLARFGLVSVLGLGLDLGVAWALAALAGVALPLAALCGFLAGAALNYGLHRLWTFSRAGPAFGSASGAPPVRWQALLYAATLGVTLLARVGAVALLERALPPAPGREAAALALATGVSFVVNYLLSKHVVFRPTRRRASSDLA